MIFRFPGFLHGMYWSNLESLNVLLHVRRNVYVLVALYSCDQGDNPVEKHSTYLYGTKQQN